MTKRLDLLECLGSHGGQCCVREEEEQQVIFSDIVYLSRYTRKYTI